MARPRLGPPRSGAERQALSVLLAARRQALSVLLAARRSAVNASTELQLFSLVIATPEPIRARCRGQKLAAMLTTAANLRVHSSWDIETTSTVVALQTLARRTHAMLKEARELEKALVAISRRIRGKIASFRRVAPVLVSSVIPTRLIREHGRRWSEC